MFYVCRWKWMKNVDIGGGEGKRVEKTNRWRKDINKPIRACMEHRSTTHNNQTEKNTNKSHCIYRNGTNIVSYNALVEENITTEHFREFKSFASIYFHFYFYKCYYFHLKRWVYVCVEFFFPAVIVAFGYRSLCTSVIKLFEKYTEELHHIHYDDERRRQLCHTRAGRKSERERNRRKNSRQRKKVVCTKNTEAMTEQKGHATINETERE